MAHKAHKLRLENVQDVFPEDLNHSQVDLEGNQKTSFVETRMVDRKRLLHHVKTKVERSQKGRTAVLFIIFTICYMTSIVLQRNCRDSQSLTSAMDKYLTRPTFRDPGNLELKTFYDIVTIDDLWLWHYEVLAPKIYTSRYYNGMLQEGKDRSRILTFNRLTTGFRMVQRRALNGTGVFCVERPQFQAFTKNCYGKTFVEGRIGDVDKSHFYSYDLKRKYQYMEEKVKGAQDANIGFFEEFGIDPDSPLEEARGHLRRLQQDMWINQGTAWLQTDFVTYNPNVGLFCFVKFTFEMLNTGEIRTHFQADTMKGRLYQTAGDIMVLIFELISIFFWLIFVIRMWRLFLLQWRATKSVMTFFEDFDHQLEFVQNVVFLGVIGLRFMIITYPIRNTLRVTEDDITVSAIKCDGDKACAENWWDSRPGFTPETVTGRQMFYDSLGFLEAQYYNLNGANSVFCLIRILSYLRINPNISQLTDTFVKCRQNMTQFAVVLCICIGAFDVMGVLMFGGKLPEFQNLGIGFVTTAQYMLGAGDIARLMEADSIGAPIFYYPFTFVMVFVVLNMTIAIIMDGYLDAQNEKKEKLKWREDLGASWLAAQHPDRAGWKEAIHNKSFYSQLQQGTIRFIGILFAWALPKWIRNKRIPITGELYDRFDMPDMRVTLRVLAGLDDDEKLNKYISWDDYYRLVKSGSTEVKMNPDIAKWIVDRYNAWQKISLDDEVVEQEDEDMKKQQEEEVFQRVQKLIQVGISALADGQKIEGKVDSILRSISVPDEVFKAIMKKSKLS